MKKHLLTKDKLNNQSNIDSDKISEIKEAYKSKIDLYEQCLKNINMLLEKYENADKNYLVSISEKVQNGLDLCNEQFEKLTTLEKNYTKMKSLIDNSASGYEDSNSEKKAKIIYFGKLFKENSDSVKIVYGFTDDWKDTGKIDMIKTEYGFYAEIKLENFNALNFCFVNELNRWDNNNFDNYSFNLKSNVFEFSDNNNYSLVIEDKMQEYKRKLEESNKKIQEYNEEFKELKNNFFNISIYEENSIIKYVENQMNSYINNIEGNKCKTQDNGTLLISEIQNKVILPYTGQEVEAILSKDSNKYKDTENVINDNFVKPLSYYKDVYLSRLRETYKLLTEREDFTKLEATDLALELFRKRFLHPAIISACKNLDELDVYLDCLSKNELDDFKIFDIKYELYPVVIKENKLSYKLNIFRRIINWIKKFLSKNKQTGKRYNN